MKKIGLTIGVTALSTVALCGGALAILANNPSTKNMFDFTGKNQQTISQLKNEIANKELALNDKNNQLAGLQYLINNKDTTIEEKDKEIANLQNSNIQKDNQIIGYQTTIEELLAGPKKYHIEFTEDMSFPAGVTLLNVTDDIVLFSGANNKSTTGLWKFVRSTGKTTKILEDGYNYANLFKISDGRILLLNGSVHTFAVCDSLFNEFTFCTSAGSYTGVISGYYSTYETDTYFVYAYGNSIFSFNKLTNNMIRISDYYTNCYFEDNHVVSFYSSTKGSIYSLEDGKSETFESSARYLPFKTEKGVYLLSSTSLSKFDYETRTITLLQDGLNISTLGQGVKLFKDGIYFTTTYKQNNCSLCLIDINQEKVYVFGETDSQEIIELDNTGNEFLIKGTYKLMYINISTGTSKSINSTYSINNFLILNSDYLVYNDTNDKFYIYDLNQLKSVLSFDTTGFKVNSFEDLGEGKYKLIADDGVGIFDSVNTTFTFMSIIID